MFLIFKCIYQLTCRSFHFNKLKGRTGIQWAMGDKHQGSLSGFGSKICQTQTFELVGVNLILEEKV